jgi:hypothetical protein
MLNAKGDAIRNHKLAELPRNGYWSIHTYNKKEMGTSFSLISEEATQRASLSRENAPMDRADPLGLSRVCDREESAPCALINRIPRQRCRRRLDPNG